MERAAVEQWVRDYERAWRTAGTEHLVGIFTHDVAYLPSPWAQPVEGLEAVAEFWDAERKGPDEQFVMTSEVVAVDDATAVVRVAVDYSDPDSRWRDLWVLTFGPDGRCAAFEEWPFAPSRPDGH
ncbi:MAG: nuclear transport factor 2 family protein [Actinomycetota bacterium]|nr:nuclear transport factor 2 family protein [Actinomycetota bacterium]